MVKFLNMLLSDHLPRQQSSGMAYYQEGDTASAPIVLIHGVGLCADSWIPQILSLRSLGTVYAVDLPGHGGSAALTADKPSLEDFVECISNFIKQTVRQPANIIGHSLGALLALLLADRYPHRVSSVIALSTIFQRSKQAQQAVQARATQLLQKENNALISATICRWFGERPTGENKQHARQCKMWLEAVPQAAYAAAYAAFASTNGVDINKLRQLSIPVLCLTGVNDVNSTPTMTKAMAISIPYGRAAVIDNSAHMVHLQAPESVNDEIMRFYADCVPQKTVA